MNIFNKKDNKPVHDLRKQEVSSIETFLTRIAPYVVMVMLMILFAMMIFAFGHVFATEANIYYYHGGV